MPEQLSLNGLFRSKVFQFCVVVTTPGEHDDKAVKTRFHELAELSVFRHNDETEHTECGAA